MTNQTIDRIGKAAAGMACGFFLFLFSMFAIMRGDEDGEGVLWWLVGYVVVGGILGATLGERFFRFIERHWFKRD